MASRAALSGLALAEMVAGVILAWSGIENATLVQTIRSLAQGQKPAPGPPGNLSGEAATAAYTEPGTVYSTGPAGGGTDTQNRALGRFMAASYGWATGTNWQALDYGWGTLESGWNNQIYSGGQVGGPYQPNVAYGIPQALGHGPDGAPYPAGNTGNPPGAGGSSSAVSQIAWGLAYIKQEYGSPSKVPGWLGQGGYSGY
jgi:hypothetical protein